MIRVFNSKILNKHHIKRLNNRLLSTQHHEYDENETHFGFQKVKTSEKVKEVYNVFESVADKYDLMNDAMSLGIHRIWKDIFISRLDPSENTKLLDMAGGTGDIAFRFLNYIKTNNSEHNCHVTVCDINENMLEVGKKRFRDLKLNENLISWDQANAEHLQYNDNQFNAYTIAFGLRNVTHIDRALAEAYRVLAPGGRFLCLEFSHVDNALINWCYDQYSFQIIPVLGQLLAGQWRSYQYLVESIRQFPHQDALKQMIETAGFRCVTYENLTFGVVAIHSGFKL